MNDLSDNKSYRGYYPNNGSVTNGPSFIGDNVTFVSFQVGGGPNIQIATGNEGSAIRNRIYNTWSPWARIDNFGCTTLAELKAALAAI